MPTNAADSQSPKITPSHPPIQQMVDDAINALKQRNGSSLFAIKKYITANYDADVHKLDSYIKKYLKKSVVSGKFHQAKGKGASGSFKLSALGKKEHLKTELAMMKKKSLSPVKPKTKLNIKTSDKLKKSLKPKAVSKPEVDVKAKSEMREKDRIAVAKLLKIDAANMKSQKNGKAKQTNGDDQSPKGKKSKKHHS